MLEAQMNDIKNHNPLDEEKYQDIKKERNTTMNELSRFKNNYEIEFMEYSSLLNYNEFKNIHKIQMNIEDLILTPVLEIVLESISTH